MDGSDPPIGEVSRTSLTPVPPRQARSRRTLERILAATEVLLAEAPFEEITVAEVAARAGISIGTLYGRFRTKRALLAAVCARRFGAGTRDRSREYLRRFAEREMSLRQRAREIVGNMLAHYGTNRVLLQELDVRGGRRGAGQEAAALRELEKVFHEGWAASLLANRSEIDHPDPDGAVRFALFLAASACHGALVREDPSAAGVQEEDLAEELTRLVIAYLRHSGAAYAGAASVARRPG